MKISQLISNDPRVESISDESSSGDGIWVYLKPGYSRDGESVHNVHENTWTECLRALRHETTKCDCARCSTDYQYVRAWCEMMGSYPYYVQQQIDEARNDGAPADAIYKSDGRWHRLSEITNKNTKLYLQKLYN